MFLILEQIFNLILKTYNYPSYAFRIGGNTFITAIERKIPVTRMADAASKHSCSRLIFHIGK